jgi:inhibitor of cysteine peptidase
MMKALLIFPLLLLLSLGSTRAADVCVSERDTGKKVVLHCGDILLVQLPANPTTGFLWSVSHSKAGVVNEQGESQYQRSSQGQNMVGAGGMEVWRYRAERAGRTDLTFSYARPWEKGVSPARVLKWFVLVN